MRKTRIIIPCFNEAKRLDPEAFLRAMEKDAELSFLFVNDGSTDETSSLLEGICRKNPSQAEFMTLEKNSGKAEAVRRGMLQSLASSFDYIGYWDADLATPLDEIGKFCRLLDATNAELVIGSRVSLLGRNIARRKTRHYLGRIFATFASMLLNIPVYDTQCGAKIFRNSAALQLVFGRPFKVNWTFDVEIFARIPMARKESPLEASSRWVELPLDEWVDVKGSKVRAKDFVKAGFEYCLLFYYLKTPARKAYEQYLFGLEPA